jgi:uncharacterized SAM-binding protein YcdF (DUF218 family)
MKQTRPPSFSRRDSDTNRPNFLRIALRAVIGLFFLILTLGAAAFMFPRQVLTIDSGHVVADEIIVLGGGDGRAERAAELFRQGEARRVLVTGFGDCRSNVDVLEKNGVPATAITAEPNALTTLQNAEFSLPILRRQGVTRAIIVTSWFHSRRALACFRHFAPDIQFYSRPSYLSFDPQPLRRAGFNEHVNEEYLKIIGYWVRYGVFPR